MFFRHKLRSGKERFFFSVLPKDRHDLPSSHLGLALLVVLTDRNGNVAALEHLKDALVAAHLVVPVQSFADLFGQKIDGCFAVRQKHLDVNHALAHFFTAFLSEPAHDGIRHG